MLKISSPEAHVVSMAPSLIERNPISLARQRRRMGTRSINVETGLGRAAVRIGSILSAKLVNCGTVNPNERISGLNRV